MSCFFVKLSLGLGYLRILRFRHIDSQWARITCYAVIIATCATNLEVFFQLLFRCVAQGFKFHETAQATITGQCVDRAGLTSLYVQTSINVVVDLVLVILPITSVVGAFVNRRIRFSIVAVILLGAWQGPFSLSPNRCLSNLY